MELSNFSLLDPVESPIVLSEGLEWDLHNFAWLDNVLFSPHGDTLTLTWRVPDVPNPWGCFENKHAGCKIEFVGLKLLLIGQPDPAMPRDEDQSLVGISKAVPGSDGRFRFKKDWQTNEPFTLVFSFQSGRSIEILSETARLIPLKQTTVVRQEA